MKTDSIIADIIFGIVFSCLGYTFIFRRQKIITALLSSNKVFWENLGFAPDDKKGVFMTNIMIPVMGIVFLAAGLVLLYKFIIHFVE